MDTQPRSPVGTSWVTQKTGLDRTTIKRAAAKGLIPSATKLLGRWRYDPALIEAWIAAGQPTPQTTKPEAGSRPAHPASTAEHQLGRGRSPESTPELVVIYPDAPWRGISDMPAEEPARQAGRRRARR